jgi:ADP-ribose pyrophosphatase YjhB (NUDIX family)
MKLQVGVKVLLKNTSGKYLLQRRNPKKYPEAQIGWDIVGGRIVPGVPLLENLKREVKEETGLTLLKVEKLLAAQDILRVKGKHIVRITYLGKAKGKIMMDKKENTQYNWISLKNVKKLPKKSLDMYLAEVLKELK